jgi:hypothetical protein
MDADRLPTQDGDRGRVSRSTLLVIIRRLFLKRKPFAVLECSKKNLSGVVVTDSGARNESIPRNYYRRFCRHSVYCLGWLYEE